MSNKFFKKLRKEARLEVNRKFDDGIAVLATMIKPRPKWIPKQIWFLGYKIVFKNNVAKIIYDKLQ